MTDIVERLRRTLLDRDNFPRMDSEKWLPVGLAKEAADEIERLREGRMTRIAQHEAEIRRMGIDMGKQTDEIERLRTSEQAWRLSAHHNERLVTLLLEKKP
jgi:hypothetical protein